MPGKAGCYTPGVGFGDPPRSRAGSCHRPPPPPQPHPAWPLTHAGWDGRASSANIFRNEIAGAVFTLFIFLTLFISYLSIGGWGTVSTGTGLSASPVPC